MRVLLSLAALALGACAGPRWGATSARHCVGDERLYTAILEGASADAAGLDACANGSASFKGGESRTPTWCRALCQGVQGEFLVPDDECKAANAGLVDRVARANARIQACQATLMAQAARSLGELGALIKGGLKIDELRPDQALVDAADRCGFRSITIVGSAGGAYIVGGSVSSGLAFGVKECQVPRGIATAGLTLSPSVGATFGLQLGFWDAPVDHLDGALLGVSLGAQQGVVGASAFFSMKAPAFQAILVTLGPGEPIQAEVGTIVTVYTQNVPAFFKDAAAVVTLQKTSHGAELGEACTFGTDCKGYRLPFGSRSGIACCSGRCAETKRDFLGTWWCPKLCRRSLLAGFGTCR